MEVEKQGMLEEGEESGEEVVDLNESEGGEEGGEPNTPQTPSPPLSQHEHEHEHEHEAGHWVDRLKEQHRHRVAPATVLQSARNQGKLFSGQLLTDGEADGEGRQEQDAVVLFDVFCYDPVGVTHEDIAKGALLDTVPEYDRDVPEALVEGGDDKDKNKDDAQDDDIRNRCWNCDATNHTLSTCPRPRDQEKIKANRQLFNKVVGKTGGGDQRYYIAEMETTQKAEFKRLFRPGKLSSDLQHALGISPMDPPPFIRNMARWGYPPAYTTRPTPAAGADAQSSGADANADADAEANAEEDELQVFGWNDEDRDGLHLRWKKGRGTKRRREHVARDGAGGAQGPGEELEEGEVEEGGEKEDEEEDEGVSARLKRHLARFAEAQRRRHVHTKSNLNTLRGGLANEHENEDEDEGEGERERGDEGNEVRARADIAEGNGAPAEVGSVDMSLGGGSGSDQGGEEEQEGIVWGNAVHKYAYPGLNCPIPEGADSEVWFRAMLVPEHVRRAASDCHSRIRARREAVERMRVHAGTVGAWQGDQRLRVERPVGERHAVGRGDTAWDRDRDRDRDRDWERGSGRGQQQGVVEREMRERREALEREIRFRESELERRERVLEELDREHARLRQGMVGFGRDGGGGGGGRGGRDSPPPGMRATAFVRDVVADGRDYHPPRHPSLLPLPLSHPQSRHAAPFPSANGEQHVQLRPQYHHPNQHNDHRHDIHHSAHHHHDHHNHQAHHHPAHFHHQQAIGGYDAVRAQHADRQRARFDPYARDAPPRVGAPHPSSGFERGGGGAHFNHDQPRALPLPAPPSHPAHLLHNHHPAHLAQGGLVLVQGFPPPTPPQHPFAGHRRV